MKIILKEQQLKNINESLGVSEASLAYVNLLYSIIEPKVIEMIAVRKNDTDEFYVESDEILKDFKGNMNTFYDFPIEMIEVDLVFKVTKKKPENGLMFSTWGAAYPLTTDGSGASQIKEPDEDLPVSVLKEVDQVIQAKFDFEVFINQEFDDKDIDELLYDLRDTITHELNHMYEFYNRILNTGSSEFSLAKSFAGGRNVNTPKKIFRVYAKFLDYLYYSEPWEINANIQEAYSKLLRMSWEEFKNGKQYKIAEAMENYSGEQMFDELYNATMERSPEAVLFHIKNLHKFYLKQYLQYVKSERGDDITSEEELMKDEVFKTRNILELFKKFETRINNAGAKLKRNYARLNAIERND
jgi:hypothetical protein